MGQLKYDDGQDVRLGDKVMLPPSRVGEVVCLIEGEQYTTAYTRNDWADLKTGFLVEFETMGLVHYEVGEPELKLLRRA